VSIVNKEDLCYQQKYVELPDKNLLGNPASKVKVTLTFSRIKKPSRPRVGNASGRSTALASVRKEGSSSRSGLYGAVRPPENYSAAKQAYDVHD
jgi:hypothetical protein